MVFKILALGGGGTKGVLHIGALKYLEEKYGNIQQHFTGGFYGCSVGSILAIGLAFGLQYAAASRMSKKFSSFLSILKYDFSFDISKKGIFGLDQLETFFIETFDSEGIDLRNKKISDAPYPLFICASNISKKCLTIFKGDIPILDAMGASCCIPVLFRPKIINKCAYIDGGFLTNIVLNFIPREQREETLTISIIHDDPMMYSTKLKEIGVIDYLYGLYKVMCLYERKINKVWNNVDLHHSLPYGVSDVGEIERHDMINQGYILTKRFFTKGGY
jgi:NTE family protein